MRTFIFIYLNVILSNSLTILHVMFYHLWVYIFLQFISLSLIVAERFAHKRCASRKFSVFRQKGDKKDNQNVTKIILSNQQKKKE